jgi:nucleoside phosphorylase
LTDAVDLVIYVALGEEFVLALKQFGRTLVGEELPDLALTVYRGTIRRARAKAGCKLLVVPAGAMGNTRSSAVISGILAQHKASNVVGLGIAGSIGEALQPGDVFVPQSVNEYMANAAATGTDTPIFTPSGNRIPVDPRLLNRTQMFPANHPKSDLAWNKEVSRAWKSLVRPIMLGHLKKSGIRLRPHSKVLAGEESILGSGPAVAKGQAFAKWIKASVRKTEAVEMESAGVLDAAHIRTPAPRTLIVRGISDYGDERKKLIEDTTRGAFRRLAIHNATAYLIRLIEAGVFSEAEADGM